ncbi:MAG: DHA2 family efflux MFS transporter permease subunit [Methanophagales archaeon ANME-1-THS]|nr:MAG: DHA2 family efflux MFS transporter permease subunit [Methanophagales archaeon ANME-1-THS]
MLGSIMTPIDASVVNTVLPSITDFFHAELSTAQWVPMVYLLMISSLLLTSGRLGDIIGYRTIYLSGLAGFILSSALCGFSRSVEMLIAARALQGLTAGMMMAVSFAIIIAAFPPSQRGKALGISATSIAAGLAIGPTLGGFIASYLGWRFIFYINIPIGIAGFLLGVKVLPGPSFDNERGEQTIDVVGAVTVFIALLSSLFAINRGQMMGMPARMLIVLVFITALLLFLYTELHVPQPMVDLSLFKIKTFLFGNLSVILISMSHYVLVFFTPFYLQRILHYTPDRIGLVMASFPLVVLIVAPLSGALSDRIGTKVLSAWGGAGTCATALLLMAQIGVTHEFDVAWRIALFGLGSGLFQSPNNSAVMGSTPRQYLGVGSGILATMRNVGMVLGIATGGAVVAYRLPFYAPSGDTAFLFALHDAYVAGALLAGIAAFTSLVRYKKEICV